MIAGNGNLGISSGTRNRAPMTATNIKVSAVLMNGPILSAVERRVSTIAPVARHRPPRAIWTPGERAYDTAVRPPRSGRRPTCPST